MRTLSTIRIFISQGRRRYLSLAAKSAQSQLPNVQQALSSDSSSSSSFYASTLASALILVGTASALTSRDNEKELGSFATTSFLGTLTLSEPMRQPRNVMLHRMRSAAGRGLNDKYKVDWNIKLGGKLEQIEKMTATIPPTILPLKEVLTSRLSFQRVHTVPFIPLD